MKLTIGIKAYNEEKHIAESVASAVEAARPFGGEVILADSGSADRTVEIAGQYPIRIVQLTRPQDRCCGAGAQLAFQHAAGEYFYLLDGDMVLKPGFMAAAVAFLDANPEFAGVGGIVNEVNTDALEFQIRAKAAKKDRNLRPGTVERLDCGGLYRTAAVREVGYYADRNLRAFEEFDLAARLQSRGWKLARIDRLAVDHYGHVMEGYALMWRRIKSGYSSACGQVVRGSMGNAHFPFVLRKLRQIWGGIGMAAWWLGLFGIWFLPVPLPGRVALFLALLLGPLAILTFRRRSVQLGLFSFVNWNIVLWGLFNGFLKERTPPQTPLAAVTLHGQTTDSETPGNARQAASVAASQPHNG